MSVIKGFAWHPTQPIYAIALHDDTIEIRELSSTTSGSSKGGNSGGSVLITLHHQFQMNIRDLQFNPVGGSTLAVITLITLINLSPHTL